MSKASSGSVNILNRKSHPRGKCLPDTIFYLRKPEVATFHSPWIYRYIYCKSNYIQNSIYTVLNWHTWNSNKPRDAQTAELQPHMNSCFSVYSALSYSKFRSCFTYDLLFSVGSHVVYLTCVYHVDNDHGWVPRGLVDVRQSTNQPRHERRINSS